MNHNWKPKYGIEILYERRIGGVPKKSFVGYFMATLLKPKSYLAILYRFQERSTNIEFCGDIFSLQNKPTS